MAHVVYVDDTDPRIQYSDGWLTATAKDAFHGTMHGSAEHGLTLTFNFTGTRVGVVGGTGDVNKFGVSSQTYELDGEPSRIVLGDKSASPDTFFYNFTYYESPDLASGEHSLFLTTITVKIVPPHIFWLDYIWYTTGNAASPSIASSPLPANAPVPTLSSTPAPRSTHPSTTTSSLSTTMRSSSTSTSSSTIAASSTFAAPTITVDPSTSQNSSTSSFRMSSSGSLVSGIQDPLTVSSSTPTPDAANVSHSTRSREVGAIVGGTIGGAAFIALLGVLAFFLFMRRRSGGRAMSSSYRIQTEQTPGKKLFRSESPSTIMSPRSPSSQTPASTLLIGTLTDAPAPVSSADAPGSPNLPAALVGGPVW